MPKHAGGFGLAAGWGFLLPRLSTYMSAMSPCRTPSTLPHSLLLLPATGESVLREHTGCSPVNLLGNHV